MDTQAAEVLDESETEMVGQDASAVESIVEPTVEAMLEMESPAVVMKGTVTRSKLFAGNWVSRVFPSVYAVMPVLSERK